MSHPEGLATSVNSFKKATTVSFLRAANGSNDWLEIEPEAATGEPTEDARDRQLKAEALRKTLSENLHSVLTTPNLLVLAGSGTSSGKVGGPSMRDLWEGATKLPKFTEVLTSVKQPKDDQWIENLLSRCLMSQGFLEEQPGKIIEEFLLAAKTMIRTLCSDFLKTADLGGHQIFLRRMARRRLRAPRLKLFTTNYDLCFETAASELGMIFVDGFSFAQPRRFDPQFFNYDIVRRAKGSDEAHDFVQGVVQLFKLHGSVNWDDTPAGIEQREEPKRPCLICPMSSKFELSYSQPHLEMMAHFQSALREPNTCLVTVGFGFNDTHLSSQILEAVKANPSFKLLAVDRSAKDKSDDLKTAYSTLKKMIGAGEPDITLLNADFSGFAELIPQLRAISPAEQIERSVRQIVRDR